MTALPVDNLGLVIDTRRRRCRSTPRCCQSSSFSFFFDCLRLYPVVSLWLGSPILSRAHAISVFAALQLPVLGTVFRGATATNDGTTAEPRRSRRCHCGIYMPYKCRSGTAPPVCLGLSAIICHYLSFVSTYFHAKLCSCII